MVFSLSVKNKWIHPHTFITVAATRMIVGLAFFDSRNLSFPQFLSTPVNRFRSCPRNFT